MTVPSVDPRPTTQRSRDAIVFAEARTCHDHLAGRRGVELAERLRAAGALTTVDERDHVLTAHGERVVADLGLDVDQLRCSHRVFARSCLDLTERRPHLAGVLPAAVTSAFLARGWLERAVGRGLRVTDGYDTHLDRWLTT